jgi:hypothetical protein
MITPNVASLGHRLFKRDWIHLDPPRHLHLFTCRSLAVLAERAGFSGGEAVYNRPSQAVGCR